MENTLNLADPKVAAIVTEVLKGVAKQFGAPEKAQDMSAAELFQREAKLAKIFESELGLKKLATKLQSPIRLRRDYVGFTRQFLAVEQMPHGVPLVKDRDFVEVSAMKVGKNGNIIEQEMSSDRIEVEPFEIKAKPKVSYTELYSRLFNTMVRLKDKCGQGMALAEDDYFFALVRAAITATGQTVALAGALSIKLLAYAFALVEQHRLEVGSVILSYWAAKDLRSLTHDNIGLTLLSQIQHKGYIGSLWGANFFVSDRLNANEVIVLAKPEFLGWMPVRKDTVVVPVDDPDNTQFGFTGYEFVGMTITNTTGAASITFSPYTTT